MTRPTRIVVAGIAGYQWAISPFVGAVCRFTPTCSEYARLAVLEYGVLKGAWLAVRRLVRCQPFHPGGFDPPPSAAERSRK